MKNFINYYTRVFLNVYLYKKLYKLIHILPTLINYLLKEYNLEKKFISKPKLEYT